MIQIAALIILFTFMIFTISRFWQFYRIVREYKDKTIAKVVETSVHKKKNKKEKPAVDVVLSHTINNEEGRSEIVVPVDISDQFPLGKEVEICYYVAGNGAVHIASSSSANKKILYGHVAAIVLELLAFILVWYSML